MELVLNRTLKYQILSHTNIPTTRRQIEKLVIEMLGKGIIFRSLSPHARSIILVN